MARLRRTLFVFHQMRQTSETRRRVGFPTEKFLAGSGVRFVVFFVFFGDRESEKMGSLVIIVPVHYHFTVGG